LYTAVVGQGAGTDQEGINWLLHKARKDHIDGLTYQCGQRAAQQSAEGAGNGLPVVSFVRGEAFEAD